MFATDFIYVLLLCLDLFFFLSEDMYLKFLATAFMNMLFMK